MGAQWRTPSAPVALHITIQEMFVSVFCALIPYVRPFIQGTYIVHVFDNVELFKKAKVARFLAWCVFSDLFHDLPFNWGTGVQFFIMDELCKCGFVFTGLDSEVAGVFIVPGLKRTICYTNILHFTVLVCDLGLVHHGLSLTFVLHRAVCFNAAVTKVFFLFLSWFFSHQSFVVFLYFTLHVLMATETCLYCLSVEYFAEWASCREVLVHQVKELLSNIGDEALVEWWVKPYFITSPSSCFCLVLALF